MKKDRTNNPGASNRNALRHAQALADFSNLSAADVDQFRRDHPGFVPDSWWDYQASNSSKKQWEVVRDWVREMWQEGFPDNLFLEVRLLLSVFDPAFVTFFDTDKKPLLGDIGDLLGEDYYPHQRGVRFLFKQPRRARFCSECTKRFVASANRDRYCSKECLRTAKNRQRLSWWNEEGKKARAKRGS